MAPTHPRAVLAANLNRMIDADVRPGERRSVRAWALSKRLDVRLIDRLTKQQHAVTLDTLQIVAGCPRASARPAGACKYPRELVNFVLRCAGH